MSHQDPNSCSLREFKLFLEDLCCDLSRFRHAAEDGTPFDQIKIDREYYLGTPGNYADIRVVPKVGDPYFLEVKLGPPDFGIFDGIINKYCLKPARCERARRLIIVIDNGQRAKWDQELERIAASIDPSLQLKVWDEDTLTEQVKKYMRVEIKPVSCETAHTIFLAIERAKASQAFGTHPNVEYHVEPVHSNLLWNFPFWTLKSLMQDGGNDPSNLYPRGKCERVAIVVADLCGFSGYVRDTPSGELVRDMLTGFYTRSRYQIHNHGGMLYQFVGDQVVCFFGIPKASPDYLRSALHAARALVHIGRSLTSQWQRHIDRAQPTGGVHVGITLGSLEIVPLRPFARSTCGATGDSFNVAARLLSVAESDEIVVSNSFYDQSDLPMKRLFKELAPLSAKNVGNIKAWKLAGAP